MASKPASSGRRSLSGHSAAPYTGAMRRRYLIPLIGVSGLLLSGLLSTWLPQAPWLNGTFARAADRYTVEQRLEQFGSAARGRLQPYFEAAGVSWPGRRVALLAFKDSAELELYALGPAGEWRFVRRYPVLAASGRAGPKLREGDFQVPEGVYRVSFLNANSRFHVSLRLNYPNDFDQRMAATDGRVQLGGDIMIHGSRVSVGCLAMGDPAAEELFTLAATLGMAKLEVLIAPSDFRRSAPPSSTQPAWAGNLYIELQRSLQRFPLSTSVQ